jgi:hypothetical protein
MMATKAALRQYSRVERMVLSGLFLAVACFFAWMAFGLLQTSWQSYALDQRFEREGVQTEGVVSGFRYVGYTGRYAQLSSGDYPVVAIETPKGTFQILSTYEYPLNKTMQAKLLGQKMAVVYLRDEPAIARVPQWHGSSFSVLMALGGVCALGWVVCFLYLLSHAGFTINPCRPPSGMAYLLD